VTGASKLNDIFPGDAEMAALMRANNWAETPLGPVDVCPNSLKTIVRAAAD
jgi:hypothetical protein